MCQNKDKQMADNTEYNLYYRNGNTQKISRDVLQNRLTEGRTDMLETISSIDKCIVGPRNKAMNIILYACDVPMTTSEYVNNYRSLPQMYGSNPLDDMDVRTIEMTMNH